VGNLLKLSISSINGGVFGGDAGKIYYLSTDNLERKSLDLTYTEFVNFCFNGDLANFYKDLRWNNWKDEVAKLDGNMAFNFFPSITISYPVVVTSTTIVA
jgi:hypothetical protein